MQLTPEARKARRGVQRVATLLFGRGRSRETADLRRHPEERVVTESRVVRGSSQPSTRSRLRPCLKQGSQEGRLPRVPIQSSISRSMLSLAKAFSRHHVPDETPRFNVVSDRLGAPPSSSNVPDSDLQCDRAQPEALYAWANEESCDS